jgi:archaellum component FlaF (FlaF/FlaG flagellin family)
LLIAFTMAVAGIFSQWAPNLLQSIQEDTSQDAVDITRASNLGLDIMSVEFNRSSNQVEVVVQNTGEPINNKTNVSIGVIGGSVANTEQHNVDLSEKEITTVSVPVERTFQLETVQASMTTYPVSDKSGIKCTPTIDQAAYWSFNEEQTKNGWTEDLSGRGVNGSLENGVSSGEGSILGESYSFDGSDDQVDMGDRYLFKNTSFSVSGWFKVSSDQDGALVSKKYGTSGARQGWAAEINPLDHTDRLIVWLNDVDEGRHSMRITASEDGDPSDGEWHNFVFTVNREKQVHRLYFDGKKAHEMNDFLGAFPDDGNRFLIGRYESGEDPVKGNIDEIQLFNRSLSESEVKRISEIRNENWAVDGCKLTG